MVVTEQHLQFFYRFYAYQKRLMAGLQETMEKLMASGVVDRIVVRPHPVEDRNTWVEWAKKQKNVDVRWEGSAIEWMLAAEAVLHPGCTTAIEGLMLDRPVFSYVPEPHVEFFNPADDVSEIVTSADDFIERLLQIRGSDEAAAPRPVCASSGRSSPISSRTSKPPMRPTAYWMNLNCSSFRARRPKRRKSPNSASSRACAGAYVNGGSQTTRSGRRAAGRSFRRSARTKPIGP